MSDHHIWKLSARRELLWVMKNGTDLPMWRRVLGWF